MKKLLLGLTAAVMYVAPIAIVDAMHDDNPVVMETRSYESISSMQDLNNIFDDVAALEADNLLQWNAINGNATAINENAILGNGLSDRVDVIEQEMLNVDRYEVSCEQWGQSNNLTIKHHYDLSREIEYWKFQNDNLNNNFIMGDINAFKDYLEILSYDSDCIDF